MRARRDEAGLTLIELLVAVTLLGIVTVPLSGAMIGGLRTTTEAQDRLSESRSPLFTAAFFAKDAQSAAVDGISVGPSPACGTGTNVVSFTWTENGTQYRSSYAIKTDGTAQRLVRSFCTPSRTDAVTVAPVLSDAVPTVKCGDAAGASVACDLGTSAVRTVTIEASTPSGEHYFTVTGTRRAT